MARCKKEENAKVDHNIFCVSARSRPTHDKRMLALFAIMTVGIELRDANATPTTIAVSDVNMTDASANAILEYDTVAHIFKQARQLLILVTDVALCTRPLAIRSRSPSFLTTLASGHQRS